MQAMEEVGYPAVLKPVVGSWGRLVMPLKDPDMARAVMAVKNEMNGPLDQIYYLQEMIKRPPRDIRTIVVGDQIVTAVYRYAPPDEWRTNVAIGGKTEACPITKELEETVINASKVVGGGVLGVDAMENGTEFSVHEINHTVEFKGAALVSRNDIGAAIIDHVLDQVRR
jgi:[lysine-biosynthesis-protein LysW]--L-2-aminoadipate ligase